MEFLAGKYDVIVIGAGHAGCEAALISARMNKKTLLVTLSLDSIGLMPCNPSIGGTGKGHLVKEIDALGGQMGLNIDKAYIQSRMLNTGKGPAVHSLRAQADKHLYHQEMKKTIEDQENLDLVMDEVVGLKVCDNKVKGVITLLNAVYEANAVILATGVYLKSKVYIGEVNYSSGPLGFLPANNLSQNLKELGLDLRRFKTGSPARVHKDTLDFSKMVLQPGDDKIIPFSFLNDPQDIKIDQVPCYLTRTTKDTKEIILNNIKRSSMYRGDMESTGPRYCPSIEDKVVRFTDKETHQFFVEPEGLNTKEMYVSGFSSSLAYEVQLKMYQSVNGMENCKMLRPAYAIEYDCVNPLQLKPSLELKVLDNLFSAGQFNGTSGYEEAAAQGLVAGINAVRKIDKKEPLILERSNSYIGVLIDDLVTKGTNEPYRIMTSRSEYRLLLRQDNADLRLTQIGYDAGSVDEFRYEVFKKRLKDIEDEFKRLKETRVKQSQIKDKLEEKNLASINGSITLYDFLKRPEIKYEFLDEIGLGNPNIKDDVKTQCEIQIKYEGYIKKQLSQVEKFSKLEHKKLREDLDYSKIDGLRIEAKQKLTKIKPMSLGQASRISGVSPADISVLMIYLEQQRRNR